MGGTWGCSPGERRWSHMDGEETEKIQNYLVGTQMLKGEMKPRRMLMPESCFLNGFIIDFPFPVKL